MIENLDNTSYQEEKFSLLKRLFGSVFLFVIALGLGYFLRLQFVLRNPPPIPLSEENLAAPIYVSNIDSSPAVTISPEMVAQKVDLQRKIIVPEENVSVNTIVELVKSSGGTVIQSSSNTIIAEFPEESDSQITEQLAAQQLSKPVEVDYPVFLTADIIDWHLSKTEVPEVWPTTQASGVRVAVVDTGVDYTHPEIAGRYAGGYDFANNDNDAYDDNGHGTHVAGIIAANANDVGYKGVAPQASILSAKVLTAEGVGYISDIVEAVDWAIKQNAQVINFSVGTPYGSALLEQKLLEAQSKGIFLVGSAGNTNGGSLMYPAYYNSVISVAATDQNDNFASFSSIGAEVSAPGVSITSAAPGGGYQTLSGTSMAAPQVSAMIALMIANKQTDIRNKLHETAVDLGAPGQDPYFGYGRIWAKPAVLEKDSLAPLITITSPQNNESVGSQVQVNFEAKDESSVVTANLFANSQLVKTWNQPPYSGEIDLSAYVGQDVFLIATAEDPYGNVGAVQVQVSVAKTATTSPTPSPTPVATPKVSTSAANIATPKPTASPTPKPTVSPAPIEESSSSAKTATPKPASDTQTNTRSIEELHKEIQNIQHIPLEIPSTTNFNQRNTQFLQNSNSWRFREDAEQRSSNRSFGKSEVKGARTNKCFLGLIFFCSLRESLIW